MSHYKPYPAYKDSGVEWIGEVPEHWSVVPLKVLAQVANGATPESGNPAYWDGDIAWFTPADLDNDNTTELTEPRRKITSAGLASCAARLTPAGSVVLSTRAPVGSVGVTCTPSATNQGCRTLVPKSGLPPKLLAETLIAARAELALRSNGTTFQELSTDSLASLRLPLAPPAERAAIAAALDRETTRIDALIAKKTRFIELLKEKRQALITHAVTKGLDPNVKMKDSGVEWIGEVPEHWSIGRLRDFVRTISTGPFGTALGSDDYVSNGVPVINPSHIAENGCVPDVTVTIDQDKASQLAFWAMRPGDIVTARRGELGRAAIIDDKQAGWICGTGSIRITPNASKIASEYVHAVLQATYARRWLELQSVGSTMPNLSEKLIGDLPIALPPAIREQQSLLLRSAEEAACIDALIAKVQRSIVLLKERRSALITAAVTGQIDLREESWT